MGQYKSNGLIEHKETLNQLVRYGIVGVSTNMLGYLLFLAITFLGVPHKLAMTGLYCVGVIVSYLSNKSWTFDHKGSHISTPVKFAMAHIGGYFLNLFLLYFGVDHLGYPYQLVQFIAVFVIAAYLFVTFKLLIFRS
jgi:putative flippase GtrA